MKLTKKRAIELHRELWDWLYHHPSKEKEDWPRWRHNKGDIDSASVESGCFLCEYTDTGCDGCPLDWSPAGTCYTGFFLWWEQAKAWQTRRKYAKLIRDLPEK